MGLIRSVKEPASVTGTRDGEPSLITFPFVHIFCAIVSFQTK